MTDQSTNFTASNGEYRNPFYQGTFEDETTEQMERRLHWATAAVEAEHVVQSNKTTPQPVEQGEPVAWATRLYNTAYHAGHHDTVEGCYTHVYPQDMDSYHEDIVQEWLADNPHPAEREIPDSYPISGQIFFREASHEWVLELTGSVNSTTFTARHTQPTDIRPEDVAGLPALYETAPDVEARVEALESLIKGYVSLLEAGRDRITSLGGDCDPVPVMEQTDPWLRDARKALAAHRKQQKDKP